MPYKEDVAKYLKLNFKYKDGFSLKDFTIFFP